MGSITIKSCNLSNPHRSHDSREEFLALSPTSGFQLSISTMLFLPYNLTRGACAAMLFRLLHFRGRQRVYCVVHCACRTREKMTEEENGLETFRNSQTTPPSPQDQVLSLALSTSRCDPIMQSVTHVVNSPTPYSIVTTQVLYSSAYHQ